jgi:hypothetical protein
MVTAAAAVKEAEQKVRDAIMREAIARGASASAAKAQVSAEAEVIVLRADASRLRDELRSAERARQRAASERQESEAGAREIAAENETLRAAYEEARREIDELNAILRARSQDITQLGQVIISVYHGALDPKDLGDMADGIETIIGPQNPAWRLRDSESGETSDGARRARREVSDRAAGVPSENPDRVREARRGERRRAASASSAEPAVAVSSRTEPEEEEEDASVPMESAFFGVDAAEISWDAPLSVRKHRPRPFGVPGLALDKLAPPPEDPDADMLEFAYEQQYGKEAAKRMVAEAKRVGNAR